MLVHFKFLITPAPEGVVIICIIGRSAVFDNGRLLVIVPEAVVPEVTLSSSHVKVGVPPAAVLGILK